ncbi:MAG: NAD(P)-dependent glycerol-3-phosphate dehydrogenase [Kiritimatiellae bacterium]|nr:NAD(P)-dependent glycerol-3-phosphate dehydrogenase [Kiritimatiellia bacterium]
MNITVIGDGGWGTAIAMLLNGYGHRVTIWGPFEDYVTEVRASRENRKFLPGITLPLEIMIESDPEIAVHDAELVILASPSKYLRQVCEKFRGLIDSGTKVVSLTKGLCETTHRRMSELAQSILGLERIAVISGPSHAEEVARGIPTAVVAASQDPKLAEDVQQIFSGDLFRVYTSPDPVGVEIGGAVKNVVAIAVGASDGLGFGDNTRAALITRGLQEIVRFGVAQGARPETFSGLSGVGDLIVTCTSRHSRNHTVGERLGKGEKIGDILNSMDMVAEGVWNSKVIHAISESSGVEMPISGMVYAVCYEDFNVRLAVETLMNRSMKAEM